MKKVNYPKLFGKKVMEEVELKAGALIQVFDAEGNDITDGKFIKAGEHTVAAAWFPVMKKMDVLCQGPIFTSMYNEEDGDGNPCFGFEGNGWHPQGLEGGLIMQSLTNSVDRWIVDSFDTMVDSGYEMARLQEDGRPIYAKPGKPQAAYELPIGWTVESLEGPIEVDGPGYYLVYTGADKGDFYLWQPELTQSDSVVRL